MANSIIGINTPPTPGVSEFTPDQYVTSERFNFMVSEIATKISNDGGKQLIGNLADLTTTNKSNVVAAVNENTSAIGQLSNKSFIPRGDLSVALGTKDLNQAKAEGGYLCVETETIKYINKPPLTGWFTLLIYLGGTGAVFQEAIQHDGIRVSRHYEGANWSPWKEIATTDKVIPYNPAPQPNLDANTVLTTSIITTGSYCTNLPAPSGLPASTEGVLTTNKYNTQFIMQTFRSIYPEQPTFTRTLYQGVWQTWGVQKQEIYIPYNVGYANNDTTRYTSKLVKTSSNQIIAYGSVKKTDGSNIAAGVDIQIAILPAGWKSKFNNQIGAVASNLDGTYLGFARVAIYDGTIFARTSIACPCIMFTVPYELYEG